jgi:hypothetical protein
MVTQAGYSLLPHPSGFCVMSTGKSRVGIPASLIATIMLPTTVRNRDGKKWRRLKGKKRFIVNAVWFLYTIEVQYLYSSWKS